MKDSDWEGQYNPGHTVCMVDEVRSTLDASSSEQAIFIDHASYGRPWFLEGALGILDKLRCREEYFAYDEEGIIINSRF